MVSRVFPRPALRAEETGTAVSVASRVDLHLLAGGQVTAELERIRVDLQTDLATITGGDERSSGSTVRLEVDPRYDVRVDLGEPCDEETFFRRDEGYQLRVTSEGMISIRASHPAGLRHGGQTLLQLLRSDPCRRHVTPQTIHDAPRMRVRGQMLDVGRKFLPVTILRREIRRMSWWKMNDLHLHLTDWNGFRIGSEALPGVASPEHYTLQELRELDDYARRWGVTIVPELEVPGHAVWLSRYDHRLRLRSAAMDVAGWPGGKAGGWMLDVTSTFVRDTVKALLSELCEVFSSDVIHIGGDELPLQQHIDATPELHRHAAYLGLPEPGDVLVEFQNDLAAHLATHGRRAEIWEWWAFGGQRKTIEPAHNIRVLKWLDDDPPTYWADRGWETIGANWNRNFCTPGYAVAPGETSPQGFEGYMPAEKNYEEDRYPHGGKALGYRLSRWMDRAEHRPYDWLDFHASWGLRAIAERTWSINGDVDAISAFERADAVGPYPGDGDDSELVVLPRSAFQRVEASSEETESFDGRASHLIDHDRRTTWSSRTTADVDLPPHQLLIVLEEEQVIGGVEIVPRQDGLVAEDFHDSTGIPRDVVVLVEDETRVMHEVGRAALVNDQVAQRVTFPPVSARSIRVDIITDQGNLMVVALSELRVLAAASTSSSHEGAPRG